MNLRIRQKSTYTLDKKSMENIEYLAGYWQVSKTEVIRRCVNKEMDRLVHKLNPLILLDYLDSNPSLLIKEKEISKLQKEISLSRKDWER